MGVVFSRALVVEIMEEKIEDEISTDLCRGICKTRPRRQTGLEGGGVNSPCGSPGFGSDLSVRTWGNFRRGLCPIRWLRLCFSAWRSLLYSAATLGRPKWWGGKCCQKLDRGLQKSQTCWLWLVGSSNNPRADEISKTWSRMQIRLFLVGFCCEMVLA